ncbi:MAG: PIN domain-containing protein [Rubrobacteraceae bacterium]
MSSNYLLDTNLLIYTLDPREPVKRPRAGRVVEHLIRRGNAALPAQTLSEFSHVCLRKLQPPLSPETVEREVERLILTFPVIPLTAQVALEALRGVRVHRMPYYDAQIWAFARLGQVPVVLSEDFNPGATIEGISFLDPLREGFEVESLG